MGRPKGSKNKPKVPQAAPTVDVTTLPPAEVKKKAGKATPPAPSVPQATQAPVTAETPKHKGGRPKGSKNKPKTAATPPPPVAPPPAPAEQQAPKKRGPKVIAPVVTTTASSPQTVVATVPSTPATPVVVTRTDDVADPEPPAPYTQEQLNHPALQELEQHAAAFFKHASVSRKLMFENKADAELTVDRAVLRTLVDFFEIDVTAVIANHGKKPKA